MRSEQSGVSYLWMMLQVLAFMACFVAAIKLIPLYLDDRLINSQIQTLLQEDPRRAAADFVEKANKRFEINSLHDVDLQDIASIDYADNGTLRIDKKYQVHKPFMANIEFVLTFEKTFEYQKQPAQ